MSGEKWLNRMMYEVEIFFNWHTHEKRIIGADLIDYIEYKILGAMFTSNKRFKVR